MKIGDKEQFLHWHGLMVVLRRISGAGGNDCEGRDEEFARMRVQSVPARCPIMSS
jgi:hypothetical protein